MDEQNAPDLSTRISALEADIAELKSTAAKTATDAGAELEADAPSLAQKFHTFVDELKAKYGIHTSVATPTPPAATEEVPVVDAHTGETVTQG
jgi:hypothetical protein